MLVPVGERREVDFIDCFSVENGLNDGFGGSFEYTIGGGSPYLGKHIANYMSFNFIDIVGIEMNFEEFHWWHIYALYIC